VNLTNVIRFCYSNIDTLSKGIDFNLSLALTMVCSTIGSIIVAFYINWQMTSIMSCIICFIPVSTHIFSKVWIARFERSDFYDLYILQIAAQETLNELNAYSKAGQIVQEVFSSLRTVLSLNGAKFEQMR